MQPRFTEEFTDEIRCPDCGFEYVHPVELSCNPAGVSDQSIRVDAHGIHIAKPTAPFGRGVVISIGFTCENGHAFDIDYRFHKGQTFLSVHDRGGIADATKWPAAIWRD